MCMLPEIILIGQSFLQCQLRPPPRAYLLVLNSMREDAKGKHMSLSENPEIDNRPTKKQKR